MKPSEKIILLLVVLCAIGFSSSSQDPSGSTSDQYRAVHWTIKEGLSEGSNVGMIKDVNGFLWITSHLGLNRFDGNNFKKYYSDKSKKNNAVAGDDVDGLIEDSLHNIWIGSDQGLSRYDIKADTFTHFLASKSNVQVVPFWATKDEVFCWDFPDFQLAAYNIHSFVKRTLVKISPADSVAYGWSDQYAIYDAATNNIWLEQGFADIPGGGLLQISLTTGKKEKFTWKCFRNIPNHSHDSEGMRYDRNRHSIWIPSDDGLLEFTLNDNTFHHIEAFDEVEKLKGFHVWAGIDVDTRGRVWLGTIPRGIVIYDPVDHSLNTLFPNDSLLQKNISVGNVLIYCDRDEIVWTGSFSNNGVYQLVPFSPTVRHFVAGPGPPRSITNNLTATIFDAGKNKIWVGTGDGINILDQNTNLFDVIRKADLGIKKRTDGIILGGVDTPTQKAWFYAHKLVYQMDMASRVCQPLIYKIGGRVIPPQTGWFSLPFRNSVIIPSNREDKDRQGIFIVNSDSAIAQQIISFPSETIDIHKTATDGDHTIFLRRPASVANLTYTLKNGSWNPVPTPIDSIPWLRIVYNTSDRSYWVAALDSIYHFSKDFQSIHKYSHPDGLPNFEICGMVTDNENNLWFNTVISICRLDLVKGRITTLTEKDGFQIQSFTPNLNPSKSSRGELYLGGGAFGQGFNRIYPSKYFSNPAFVYLQSIMVNQKPAVFSTGIMNLRELNLRYFENQITIETGILDYYSGGNSQIRYKLGEKSVWQYPVNSSRYTINFQDLPPGEYELIMQAANASNEFTGPEKKLLIRISPPWWQTWWARILFVVTLAFSLWQFIQYRYRNLKQRNVALEEKVISRTKELQQSQEELQGTRSESISKGLELKVKEMEMQALRTQMNPHFIFNCLNSIDRFIMKNESEAASDYLTQFSRLIRMVLNNSRRTSIPLEEEIEMLTLYLDLERLRFKNAFEYKIQFDEDIDTASIFIPPLLLQPFVENAIWHGLMHKRGNGVVDISFKKDKDILLCKVIDNGVGRSASALARSKSSQPEKSMGIQITKERLALINGDFMEEKVSFEIEDLFDENGKPSGTLVMLKIRFQPMEFLKTEDLYDNSKL
jgi:ligand-binding sensor domain-containing protein